MSAASSDATIKAWQSEALNSPVSGVGCFSLNYPNIVWTQMACSTPTDQMPLAVGNGYDYVGDSGSSKIGAVDGYVSSLSSFTSEYDSIVGSTYGVYDYSLQANSNNWSCSFGYSTTCWQQFVFQNLPGSSKGHIFIQYQLLADYGGLHGCPTGWTGYQPYVGESDCYLNSNMLNTSEEDPSGLTQPVQLEAMANYGSSGDDQVRMCDSSQCWSVSTYDNSPFLVNPLFGSWDNVEWNVFGLGSGSGAIFNSGTSVSVDVQGLKTDSGTSITPTINTAGTTGEWSNLNLTSDNTGSGWFSFGE